MRRRLLAKNSTTTTSVVMVLFIAPMQATRYQHFGKGGPGPAARAGEKSGRLEKKSGEGDRDGGCAVTKKIPGAEIFSPFFISLFLHKRYKYPKS
jgi:hypothetical protein